MKHLLFLIALAASVISRGQTIDIYKNTVDTSITNKTGARSITAAAVGSRFKELADLLQLAKDSSLNYTDTTSMLLPYLRKADTTAMLLPYLMGTDTAAMLLPYLRDADTPAMLAPYMLTSTFNATPTAGIDATDTFHFAEAWRRSIADLRAISPGNVKFISQDGTEYIASIASYFVSVSDTTYGTIPRFSSLASLMATAITKNYAMVMDDVNGGMFYHTNTRPATLDTAITFPDVGRGNTGAWVRVISQSENIEAVWYTTTGDTSDYAYAINRAIAYAATVKKNVFVSPITVTGNIYTSRINMVNGVKVTAPKGVRFLPKAVDQTIFYMANNSELSDVIVFMDTFSRVTAIEYAGDNISTTGAVNNIIQNVRIQGTVGKGQRGLYMHSENSTANRGVNLITVNDIKITSTDTGIVLACINGGTVDNNRITGSSQGQYPLIIRRDANNTSTGPKYNNIDLNCITATTNTTGSKIAILGGYRNKVKITNSNWSGVTSAFADKIAWKINSTATDEMLDFSQCQNKYSYLDDQGVTSKIIGNGFNELMVTDFDPYLIAGVQYWDTAINAAIRFATTHGIGKVKLPGKSNSAYFTLAPIQLQSNVDFIGDGYNSFISNVAVNFTNGAVFNPGSMQQAQFNSATWYNINSIEDTNRVVLTTAGDAANFAVGDQFVVRKGVFPIPVGDTIEGNNASDFLVQRIVTAISGANIYVDIGFPDTLSAGSSTLMISKLRGVTYKGDSCYMIRNAHVKNMRISTDAGNAFNRSAAYNWGVENVQIDKTRTGIGGNLSGFGTFKNITGNYGGRGVEMAEGPEGNKFENCHFVKTFDCGDGVYPEVVLGPGDQMDNCFFSNYITTESAHFFGKYNCSITNTTVDAKLNGPCVKTIGNNGTIRDNTFSNHGDTTGRVLVSQTPSNGWNVIGNRFNIKQTRTTASKLVEWTGDFNVFSGNWFYNQQTNSNVYLAGKGNEFSRNLIDDTASVLTITDPTSPYSIIMNNRNRNGVIWPDYYSRTGTVSFTGNASTTVFTYAHGLPAAPVSYQLEATSNAARNPHYVTVDATNITVTFITAPSAAANVTFNAKYSLR